MFSTGHLIWIAISLILIAGGLIFLQKKAPQFEDLIRVCFALGLISEIVKIFSVAIILPVVDPVVSGSSVSYIPAGQYSPYLESSHLPFELCSLQLVFYAIIIWSKSPKWKKRCTSLTFVCGSIGGMLGIVMAYIASEFSTVKEFFSSPRVWQYFLFHSMVVVVGIYAGFGKNSTISFRDIKGVYMALISLDIISLYLNSIFSEPVYIDTKPVGLLYRANFFSSYVNPIGLVLTEKWQWIAYLNVRMLIAMLSIFVLFALQHVVKKSTSIFSIISHTKILKWSPRHDREI